MFAIINYKYAREKNYYRKQKNRKKFQKISFFISKKFFDKEITYDR